ncbi:hydrogenase maturation protease [Pseudarthrobacter sp. N5]|uniref:hydrogenase maturation protease n=1 Tax=Pseudarthrobacter sp. N5 TaxID=3418416 RepID=UPI003CE7DD4E
MSNHPGPQESSGGAPPALPPRVLVAGVGNIFLRDDGFGPEVARRLAADPSSQRPGIRVTDYGIRGMHLAYDLLDGVAVLVLVDAVPPSDSGADSQPGSIRVLGIGADDVHGSLGRTEAAGALDPHGMDPVVVLGRLQALGGELPLTYLVGCVAADTEEGIGLSAAVEAAVPAAMAEVLALVNEHIPAAYERC